MCYSECGRLSSNVHIHQCLRTFTKTFRKGACNCEWKKDYPFAGLVCYKIVNVAWENREQSQNSLNVADIIYCAFKKHRPSALHAPLHTELCMRCLWHLLPDEHQCHLKSFHYSVYCSFMWHCWCRTFFCRSFGDLFFSDACFAEVLQMDTFVQLSVFHKGIITTCTWWLIKTTQLP
jgi:hypothetical protein